MYFLFEWKECRPIRLSVLIFNRCNKGKCDSSTSASNGINTSLNNTITVGQNFVATQMTTCFHRVNVILINCESLRLINHSGIHNYQEPKTSQGGHSNDDGNNHLCEIYSLFESLLRVKLC